ncbi:response regulator [Aliiroseovarius sp. KMU-50]|uniref:Response regulator n=1 Tax=Aliiroseovarius salicola TaxID=3009082 RepID=A0ABT4W6F9_9RHOB|nr:response regulator [Aliiroseovarius sp. KMU-50]MDA5095418.1 response regulator [Aliiroseovarius sp. KMU-50]
MQVLIVESNRELARVWTRSLERQGVDVLSADSEDSAITSLDSMPVDVIVMNVHLVDGNALAVADYAAYRAPNARVIFVTNSSFFSDGSIFSHVANAHACVPGETPPEDLAALVEYHGAQAGNPAE